MYSQCSRQLTGYVSEAAGLSLHLRVECLSHLCESRHINQNIFHYTSRKWSPGISSADGEVYLNASLYWTSFNTSFKWSIPTRHNASLSHQMAFSLFPENWEMENSCLIAKVALCQECCFWDNFTSIVIACLRTNHIIKLLHLLITI